MAGATDLAGLDQDHIAVAVEPDRLDVLHVPRGRALVPVDRRDREKKCVCPVASVSRKAGSSIQAIIRTSPFSASWTIAGISPSSFHLELGARGVVRAFRTMFASSGHESRTLRRRRVYQDHVPANQSERRSFSPVEMIVKCRKLNGAPTSPMIQSGAYQAASR